MKRFIGKLDETDTRNIKMEKSGIKFQFGGGEKIKLAMKISLPCTIGELRAILVTEVVNAEISILMVTNSVEKSNAMSNFGRKKAKFFWRRGGDVQVWFWAFLY